MSLRFAMGQRQPFSKVNSASRSKETWSIHLYICQYFAVICICLSNEMKILVKAKYWPNSYQIFAFGTLAMKLSEVLSIIYVIKKHKSYTRTLLTIKKEFLLKLINYLLLTEFGVTLLLYNLRDFLVLLQPARCLLLYYCGDF